VPLELGLRAFLLGALAATLGLGLAVPRPLLGRPRFRCPAGRPLANDP
jgi:hypothetical protein